MRTWPHRVVTPEQGGVVTFVGVVRNHHAGASVLRLEYSAYGPMADAEFARIVAEAEARWPARVAVEHRIGTLEVGDVGRDRGGAAAHRDAAFDACRYVIEELKRRVPIWKREHYADGTAGVGRSDGAVGCILRGRMTPSAYARARSTRPTPWQPPPVGHRPLQHALPLLHAGGGVHLAAARLAPDVRGA